MNGPDVYKEMVETSKKISKEIIHGELSKLDIFNELNNSEKIYKKLDEIAISLNSISNILLEISLQQITPLNHNYIATPQIERVVYMNENPLNNAQTQATTTPKAPKKKEETFIPTINTDGMIVNTRKNRTTTISDNISDSINKLNNINK